MAIEEWYKQPVKPKTRSMVWKSLTVVFPLVVLWTMWSIRNNKKVHVGSDPWMGVGDEYILLEKLINSLHEAKIFYLADV
jgi:hypothetical protein